MDTMHGRYPKNRYLQTYSPAVLCRCRGSSAQFGLGIDLIQFVREEQHPVQAGIKSAFLINSPPSTVNWLKVLFQTSFAFCSVASKLSLPSSRFRFSLSLLQADKGRSYPQMHLLACFCFKADNRAGMFGCTSEEST